MDPTVVAAGLPSDSEAEQEERLTVKVLLPPGELKRQLSFEARAGLTRTPKELSPKWFYDARGSQLFDAITRLPEYYPTRREREILTEHASRIAQLTQAQTVVELGSGTAEKSRLLLDALRDAGTLQRFIPVDVSEAPLRESSQALLREYPELRIHGLVGDFVHHLSEVPKDGRRLMTMLGGTIGNFKPLGRAALLGEVAEALQPGEFFLVGTDLRKEPERLHRAYNDAEGVTAAFNLNVLEVLNRELGGEFDPALFEHVAEYRPQHGWVELALRSRRHQRVELRALGLAVDFEEGEELRTEVSTKFDVDHFEKELIQAGLPVVQVWLDDRGDFALWLSRR